MADSFRCNEIFFHSISKHLMSIERNFFLQSTVNFRNIKKGTRRNKREMRTGFCVTQKCQNCVSAMSISWKKTQFSFFAIQSSSDDSFETSAFDYFFYKKKVFSIVFLKKLMRKMLMMTDGRNETLSVEISWSSEASFASFWGLKFNLIFNGFSLLKQKTLLLMQIFTQKILFKPRKNPNVKFYWFWQFQKLHISLFSWSRPNIQHIKIPIHSNKFLSKRKFTRKFLFLPKIK